MRTDGGIVAVDGWRACIGSAKDSSRLLSLYLQRPDGSIVAGSAHTASRVAVHALRSYGSPTTCGRALGWVCPRWLEEAPVALVVAATLTPDEADAARAAP